MKILYLLIILMLPTQAHAESFRDLWNGMTIKEKHLAVLSLVKGFEAGCSFSLKPNDDTTYKQCQSFVYSELDPLKVIDGIDRVYKLYESTCTPWGVAFVMSLKKSIDIELLRSFDCK